MANNVGNLIGVEDAIATYDHMPSCLRAGTLHPLYIKADASRELALQPTFWRFEQNGEVYLHGFHLAAIPGTDWCDLQSPYGYGGPLATTTNDSFVRAADSAFLEWAVAHGVVAQFIRFHPLLENWRYCSGEVILDRQTVWVECSTTELLRTYEPRVRTAVRKAMKAGVRVSWLSAKDLHAVFPVFYRRAMKEIGADDYYLFQDAYFDELLRLPFVQGAAAFLDTEIVAMAVFLCDGIGEYHLSAKNHSGARCAATNLLLHEGFNRMRMLGLNRAHLGGGATAHIDDPLKAFKSGFSTNRAEFRIAKRIYIPEAYEALKRIYSAQHALHPQRVLFYRS